MLGALWFAGTGTALRTLAARAVESSAGRLTLEDVRGSLYGPLRVGRFVFEHGRQRIEGRELHLDWAPRELLWQRTVVVRVLALQSLSIDTGGPAAAPPQLPSTLRLPLRVEIRRASVDTLAVASAGVRHEFSALTLALQTRDRELHARASAKTPWGLGEAELTLADGAPYALGGSAALRRDDGLHPYAVRATLTGTLAALLVSATGNAGGAGAELRASIAPLARTPLQQATLRLERVDARRFAEELPRTEIGAQIALRAQGDDAYAGEVKLANRLPGSIDRSRAPLRAAQFTFQGAPEALELEGVRLDFGDAGSFTGAGGLRQGGLKLDLRTTAFDLRGIYSQLTATRLAGSLRLDLQDGAQTVQADLRQGAYNVRVDAARRGDAVEIRSANVSVAGGELAFSGAISLVQARSFNARGSFSHFDPSRLGDYPAARINGSFSARGHASPTPEAALEFSTSDSRLRGYLLRGEGRARVSAQRIWASDIELELGANRVSARGAFGAPGDSMDWRIKGGDLGALAAQLSGSLSASGTLAGTVAEPSGSLRARGRNLVWAGKHRVAEFSAEGKINQGIDGPLTLAASLRGYRSAALNIEAASVAAKGRRGEHELKLSARNAGIDARAALAGGWSAATGWSGRILSLENRGRYALALETPASLAFHGADFALGPAALKFARGTVRVEEFSRRGGGLSSAGTLSGIDSRALLALLDRPLDVSSTLTLGGRWKLAAAQAINGQLDLRREQGDLSVHSEPATAVGLTRLAFSATATDDRLSAKLEAAGAVLGTISVGARTTLARDGGSVGLSGNSGLSFDAQLELPSLAWATPLLGARMAVDGRVKAQINGEGTMARPRLSGNLTADGLKFEFPEQGVYLKDGVLLARLLEDRLLLDRIALRGGEGTIEGRGSIAWKSGKASTGIELKASKLEVTKRLDRHLVLSGKAKVTLEDARVHATAMLKADLGEIALPKGDTPTLSEDVVVLGRDGDEPKKIRPLAVDFDLDLDLGEKFHLIGKGIDATLAGAVRVRASSGAPVAASGSIRVSKGSYSAYGQRLTIERGILNFTGPLDNPGLDIVALRKKQPVEAGVAVRGTVLAPRISLVSRPSVPDSEKLSWLILGRGMDSANPGDLALLQAAAGALLARGDSVMLQDRIAHAAGLDEVALSGSGGLETTVLSLGKRLSSQVYLTFEQGLAAATHLVKINYTLTPRLSVRAQTGNESALDAFYTFSFK